MAYQPFNANGRVFSLTHLNPRSVSVNIDNDIYDVSLEFGCHCFTDEKQNGPFYRREGNKVRYWSEERYNDSLMLPNLVQNLLVDHSTYIVPFKKKKKEEQYHYLDNGFYAIFFYIKKIDIIQKTMTIYVVSAYDKSIYNGQLPVGKAYRLSWVLSERVKGKFIIK